MEQRHRRPAAVDLFCGVGGLSYGLRARGVNVVAGIDSAPSCRYPYETNVGAKFIEDSIERVTSEQVAALYPDGCVRVLVGCAPCQPFSLYSQKRRDDGQWALLQEFVRLVDDLRPDIVSMENVPRVTKHEVFASFLECLDRNGYRYPEPPHVVTCADYGVPQTRKRLVLLASRIGDIGLVPPSHSADSHVSVREAIGGMPPVGAGQSHHADPLHTASNLSALNLQRIRATPEGGGWGDWPEELRAACHRRPSGKTYSSVYGRMKWDEPAPTMTTQCHGYGNGRFGHPDQDRAISLREAAMLQTFPRDYQFTALHSPVSIGQVGRHIGNAVPVKVAEAVGESILRHLGALG